jgi:hypothetical protein
MKLPDNSVTINTINKYNNIVIIIYTSKPISFVGERLLSALRLQLHFTTLSIHSNLLFTGTFSMLSYPTETSRLMRLASDNQSL